MKAGSGKIRLVGCGILEKEFLSLPEELRESFDSRFLDSELHIHPERLDRVLGALVEHQGPEPIVFLFGDCCPHMAEMSSGKAARRVRGANCIEIYLGTERYRRMRKEGTFFLMPEWAQRWERIVKEELGLDTRELAREFMADTMTKAAYVDTGSLPVPHDELAAFSEYTGLTVDILPTGTEYLREALEKARKSLPPEEIRDLSEKSVDA